MKKCKKCNHFQDESNFCKGKLKKNGTYSLHSWCKKCVSNARMKTYYNNPKAHRDYDNKRNNKLFENLKQYLQTHPCADCKNDNLMVLEFDHRDPSTKEMCVSEIIRCGRSWEKILLEIEKCDVVCANCHRIRTYIRDGSWRN